MKLGREATVETKGTQSPLNLGSEATASSPPTKIQIFSKNTGVRPFFTSQFTQYYIFRRRARAYFPEIHPLLKLIYSSLQVESENKRKRSRSGLKAQQAHSPGHRPGYDVAMKARPEGATST